MENVLSLKCEQCGKTYFANTSKDHSEVTPEELLELFKFQIDDDDRLSCPACHSDSIEVTETL